MKHHLLATILAGALLATGCPRSGTDGALGAPPPVCSNHLDALTRATYDEGASQDIRGWLSCLVASDNVGAFDLESTVARILQASALPGIQRSRDGLIEHFFDTEQLKALPTDYARLQAYESLLKDQALVARANGDPKLAEAMEARANKIDRLARLLEDVVE